MINDGSSESGDEFGGLALADYAELDSFGSVSCAAIFGQGICDALNRTADTAESFPVDDSRKQEILGITVRFAKPVPLMKIRDQKQTFVARSADLAADPNWNILIRTSALTLPKKVGHDLGVAEQERTSRSEDKSQIDLAAESLASLSGRDIVAALRKAALPARKVAAVQRWAEETRLDRTAAARDEENRGNDLPLAEETTKNQRESLAELLECTTVPERSKFASLLRDISGIRIMDAQLKDVLVNRLKAFATLCDAELLYEGRPIRSMAALYRGRGTGTFDFRTDDPTVAYQRSAFPSLSIRRK